MSDNQKKYEEAAKKYSLANIFPDDVHQACYRGFLTGASLAEKENERLLTEKDQQLAFQHEIHKNAEKENKDAIRVLQEAVELWQSAANSNSETILELRGRVKEAHNAAIDACLDLMDSNQALYHAHSRLKTDIQKLKL